MNKTTLTTLALAALGLASAQAGTGYVSYGKSPKAPAPMAVPSLCECFNANTANFSVFAAGLFSDDVDLGDAAGGGIAADYFFTENIGLQGSYAAFGTDTVVHQMSGSIVLRFPIKSICLAPYVLAGGSYHTDSVNQGTAHVGAGLDYRFSNCIGIFADGQYNWADDTSDYVTVRGGLRFGF